MGLKQLDAHRARGEATHCWEDDDERETKPRREPQALGGALWQVIQTEPRGAQDARANSLMASDRSQPTFASG